MLNKKIEHRGIPTPAFSKWCFSKLFQWQNCGSLCLQPEMIEVSIETHCSKSLSSACLSLCRKSRLFVKVNWVPMARNGEKAPGGRQTNMGAGDAGCCYIALLRKEWCWNSWNQPKKLPLELYKIPGAPLTTAVSLRYSVQERLITDESAFCFFFDISEPFLVFHLSEVWPCLDTKVDCLK